MTRSIDSSRNSLLAARLSLRAVSSAASLITLARSAPEKPGVRRATESRSTSGVNGLPLACTRRMALRPSMSGLLTRICRAKRPGRRSAGGETAGAQQRGVEEVGPVGGRDQDDPTLGVEAVHLDEQLVERLLALVVTAAHAGAAVPADGVDLVDEDDGRRVGLGLLEQVADAAGADTDEHLDEVGTGDRVE